MIVWFSRLDGAGLLRDEDGFLPTFYFLCTSFGYSLPRGDQPHIYIGISNEE